MIDSTESRAVVDERTTGAGELVVECDGGGEAEEALQDALSEPGKSPCAVAFEGEDVLARPEDRLDALADRREVWASSGLVFAPGPDYGGVHVVGYGGEPRSGVALVADQSHSALAAGAGEQLQGHLALIAFGRCHGEGPRGAVWGKDRVQAEAPEEPAVAGAIPIVSGVSERRALDGLATASALHRCGIHEQQIVIEPGALAGEDLHQPLQRVREPAAALEVAGLGWEPRKQMSQPLGSDRQE